MRLITSSRRRATSSSADGSMGRSEFDIQDLDATLPDPVRDAMLNVILSFAKLDSALSSLLIKAYGMPLDRGAILIENMDTGNKINRIKKLYRHTGPEAAVKSFATLKEGFEANRDVRNTIAHATYVGVKKSDNAVAVFSPIRASVGYDGQLEVLNMPVSRMDDAARWADTSAQVTMQLYKLLGGTPTEVQ